MIELLYIVGVLLSWVSVAGVAYTTGYDHAIESQKAGDSA